MKNMVKGVVWALARNSEDLAFSAACRKAFSSNDKEVIERDVA